MAKSIVRTLRDLGDDITLAPERHLAHAGNARGGGVTLGSLVVERNERVVGEALQASIVLDTTHAKDGVLDVHAARASAPATSAKKRVRAGDLIVSRLRPYLRQIALVHPAAVALAGDAMLACSTEFYVLAPPDARADLAYLLPFLLGDGPQAALAAGQEGGHHPRVPKETLFALRVPVTVASAPARAGRSREIRDALARLYDATRRYRALVR